MPDVDVVGGMAKMAEFRSSMNMFKQAAATGSFAVNEAGGAALLRPIRDMAKWVDGKMRDLNDLARKQPLGTSNGANLMKPYLQQVASDEQGFITQLREFKSSLADAEQGILDAMKNYDSTEQGVRRNFRAV